MTRRHANALLNAVIGSQPNLEKLGQGYGRVATQAHPDCTCKRGAWSSCEQHKGIRWGQRYAKAPELAL